MRFYSFLFIFIRQNSALIIIKKNSLIQNTVQTVRTTINCTKIPRNSILFARFSWNQKRTQYFFTICCYQLHTRTHHVSIFISRELFSASSLLLFGAINIARVVVQIFMVWLCTVPPHSRLVRGSIRFIVTKSWKTYSSFASQIRCNNFFCLFWVIFQIITIKIKNGLLGRQKIQIGQIRGFWWLHEGTW